MVILVGPPVSGEAFVTAAAAAGATGIGAGVGYMGARTIHVGFGLTPSDQNRLTWRAGGTSATAPLWLQMSAQQGWQWPVVPSAFEALEAPSLPKQD